MSGVGLLLGLAIAYFVRGSLEEFPTDEQVGKVRLVMAVAAAVLVVVEVGLWRLLRSLERVRGSHRRGIDGGAPPAA